MNPKVYITKIATFFPNNPVFNDEMENYLGMVNGKPSLARRIVLKSNGIKSRYYALDAQGNVTHTNVQMAARAVEKLYDAHFSVDDIELLSAGTATPEQIMPSHGVMVHGLLKGKNVEVVSFAGSCCTGIQALKYAFLSILSGEKSNAVCVASERFTAWTQAKNFESEIEKLSQLEERPIIAFEKEFLRWMLSDGAGAFLLQNRPAETGFSFEIKWIELTSYANQMETCMYAGGEKNEKGELLGWTLFPESEWLTKSLFSVKQDTRLLGNNIISLGGKFLMEIAKKRSMEAEDIDWFLPHLSSMFFKDKIMAELDSLKFHIPEEKWVLNLPEIGNVASVSNFAMMNDLLHSGKLKKGDNVLWMVPESARFSYGYALLTVC